MVARLRELKNFVLLPSSFFKLKCKSHNGVCRLMLKHINNHCLHSLKRSIEFSKNLLAQKTFMANLLVCISYS